MELLWPLFIGIGVGGMAGVVVTDRAPGGFIVYMLLGIGGAFVAVVSATALGWFRPTELQGILGAALGSVIVLVAYRLWVRPQKT